MSFGQEGPFGPGGSPSTPDWAALADDTASRNRRRKLLMIGGGVLATLAIGGIVAMAVVSSGGSNDKPGALPSPQNLPSGPKQPEPTFSDVSVPPPPDPREFISNAKKDTAPLNAGTLFPGQTMVLGDRSYAKGATATTKNCAGAASGKLAAVLTGNNCTQVIRATYSKSGVAVTIGVAVFATEAQATKAKEQSSGNIQSLAGGGVPTFCRATACRLTANSIGRYAYFTVAGYTSGKAVPPSDTKALQAGKDASDFAFRSIVRRGQLQASAAATAQGNG